MAKSSSSRMDCAAVRKRLSAFEDGEGTPAWRLKIEAHLEACPECRQALAELRNLWQALDAPISVQTRLGFTQDVMRKINGGVQSRRHDWFRMWGRMFPAPAGIALVAMLGLALGGWLGHSLVGIDGQLRGDVLAGTAQQSITLEALDVFSPMPKGSLAHGYLTLAGEVAQ